MDTFLMTNTLNLSHDPFLSFSSLDPTTTLLDPPQWPWMEPKLSYSFERPIQLPEPIFTEAQMEAYKSHLTSPLPTPTNFFFEFEPDMTTNALYFDDFPEKAPSQDLEAKAEWLAPAFTPHPTPTPLIDELPTCIDPAMLFDPSTNPDELFDFTYFDTSNEDFPFDAADAAPTPPLIHSSPSPSSSRTVSSCPTPDAGVKTWIDIQDDEDVESIDNPLDADYCPFQIQNRSPVVRKMTSKKARPQPQNQTMQVNYLEEPFPQAPKAKMKRKAPSTHQDAFRSPKRQKYDPEVICRVGGCRHVSKTRFECFKHRETHFPGRFQCPQPTCRKIFVRSSSLARHLKRPRNAECGVFAGTQQEWGTGLINFALCPPQWLEPGYLDDVTEA